MKPSSNDARSVVGSTCSAIHRNLTFELPKGRLNFQGDAACLFVLIVHFEVLQEEATKNTKVFQRAIFRLSDTASERCNHLSSSFFRLDSHLGFVKYTRGNDHKKDGPASISILGRPILGHHGAFDYILGYEFRVQSKLWWERASCIF